MKLVKMLVVASIAMPVVFVNCTRKHKSFEFPSNLPKKTETTATPDEIDVHQDVENNDEKKDDFPVNNDKKIGPSPTHALTTPEAFFGALNGHYESTASSQASTQVLRPFQSVSLGTLYEWLNGPAMQPSDGFSAKVDITPLPASAVSIILTRLVRTLTRSANVSFSFSTCSNETDKSYCFVDKGTLSLIRNSVRTDVGSMESARLTLSDTLSHPRGYRFSSGSIARTDIVGDTLRVESLGDSKIRLTVASRQLSDVAFDTYPETVFVFDVMKLPK